MFDPSASIFVMELLGSPNIILRHAIVKGDIYPAVAKHVGRFLATTLFNTSLLALDTHKFRWVGCCSSALLLQVAVLVGDATVVVAKCLLAIQHPPPTLG